MNEIIKQQAHDLAAKLAVSEMAINDLDEQIKSLQSKKKSLQAGLDEFKDDLRAGMAENGIVRIESEEHGIMFRLDKPVVRVEIDDESALDEKFYRVKKEIDRTAVKKCLQIGEYVQGARLVEGKHRLTVKM